MILHLEYASYLLPPGKKEGLGTVGCIYTTFLIEEFEGTYMDWCTPTWSLHDYPCHFENVHAKSPEHGPVHAELFLSTCNLLSTQKRSVHLLLSHSGTSSWERHWTPTEDLWDFYCQAGKGTVQRTLLQTCLRGVEGFLPVHCNNQSLQNGKTDHDEENNKVWSLLQLPGRASIARRLLSSDFLDTVTLTS